jgi:hypothetical protein
MRARPCREAGTATTVKAPASNGLAARSAPDGGWNPPPPFGVEKRAVITVVRRRHDSGNLYGPSAGPSGVGEVRGTIATAERVPRG